MSDLREELGRLADEVGEPVTFHTLQLASGRRERRRRSSAIIVALTVAVAAGAFFAATYSVYRTAPVVPEGSPVSTPLRHASPLQHEPPKGATKPLVAPRCLSGVRVVGNGSQLATCSYWPSGAPLTVSFTIEGSATMKLALYPARGCDERGCDQAPVWRGKPFSGPGETTLHVRALRWGRRYLLLDRLHPAAARVLIIPG